MHRLSFASTSVANNCIYLELGGNAAIYSLNYEKNFDANWGVRAGVGSLWLSDEVVLGMPVLINKYWGSDNSNHKFETGIGAVYFTAASSSDLFRHKHDGDFVGGTASIGYRYLPKTKGMTFKVAFTPVIKDFFIPWLGFSVGHTF